MKTFAEVARGGCVLCGRTPVVLTGCVLPVSDAAYTALMRMRVEPIDADETPALRYGLCRKHANDPAKSVAHVQAMIDEATEKVVAH